MDNEGDKCAYREDFEKEGRPVDYSGILLLRVNVDLSLREVDVRAGVAVRLSAGPGDVLDIDRRFRVFRRPDIVHSVAACAICHRFIAVLYRDAVKTPLECLDLFRVNAEFPDDFLLPVAL